MKWGALNPLSYFGQRGASTTVLKRAGDPQGLWTNDFDSWVPRQVAPRLYEVIREAIPMVDSAINALRTLDGILVIEAESDSLQNLLDEWAEGVQVNDFKQGLQAYYDVQGNELYEQGLALGEMQMASGMSDVGKLWVADSKGVFYRRNGNKVEVWYRTPRAERNTRKDGSDQIERLLRNSYTSDTLGLLQANGYKKLNTMFINQVSIDNEADSPYGTSKIRSLEFVAKTLATMMVSTQNTWEKFGSPDYEITLKTQGKTAKGETPDDIRKKLESNFATMLNAKKRGKNADFVNVIGKNDELNIKIIGGDGSVLEIEHPYRMAEEQIISKFDIAPWMLGRVWGTAERLADKQVDMMLTGTKMRYKDRRPGLMRILETVLRSRGATFKRGDFTITQELPNLKNDLETAQADFLRAQTELMLRNGQPVNPGENDPKQVTVGRDGKVILPTDKNPVEVITLRDPLKHAAGCECDKHGYVENHKDFGHKGESYVEDEDALMRLENTATRGLLNEFENLYDKTLDVLGLDEIKASSTAAPAGPSARGVSASMHVKAPDPTWVFSADTMLAAMNTLQDDFIATVGDEDAPLAQSMFDAWSRGVVAAAAELDVDAIEETVRETFREAMAADGLAQVTDTTVRAYADDIIQTLSEGAYDGMNPKDVARALRKRFDAHEYDWERLARSEIAAANSQGKMDQYADMEIEQYHWKRAGGACPICVGLESGGPYTVGEGPLPMKDSHPMCRCTTVAVVKE
ncbi:MAG: minor capsid protein [Gammaproteobacteria bacterium]|nr:minor capsid protein [Gammaproteobacteria bacterium]